MVIFKKNVVQQDRNSVQPETIQPTVSEQTILSAIGVQALQILKEAAYVAINYYRAQLLIWSQKKMKNILRKEQFVDNLDDINIVSSSLNTASNYLDDLPLSALNGIPALYNALKSIQDYTLDATYKTRNITHKVNQMNQSQLYYDYMVQKLDKGIRQLKGLIEYIESNLEGGTV